jgi:hypothetical protein
MAAHDQSLSPKFVHETHLLSFRPVLWMGAILVGSGLFHLVWLALIGADWEGPLSLRKPGLFGISAGVTAWSIAWVMTKLHPHRLDRLLASTLAGGLLIEVGLITIQQWRGVTSHFNHATTFDALIEASMLVLILLVTIGILWLTLRSISLPPLDESTAIALRAGLWLLTLSCGLGIMITILGELNLEAGKPPEIWGPAGVLKYPHGAALHAIQTLPMLAWLLNKFKVSEPARLVRMASWSQLLLLAHALWQTMRGRSRIDFDWIGGSLFVIAGITMIIPMIVLIFAICSYVKTLRQHQF